MRTVCSIPHNCCMNMLMSLCLSSLISWVSTSFKLTRGVRAGGTPNLFIPLLCLFVYRICRLNKPKLIYVLGNSGLLSRASEFVLALKKCVYACYRRAQMKSSCLLEKRYRGPMCQTRSQNDADQERPLGRLSSFACYAVSSNKSQWSFTYSMILSAFSSSIIPAGVCAWTYDMTK